MLTMSPPECAFGGGCYDLIATQCPPPSPPGQTATSKLDLRGAGPERKRCSGGKPGWGAAARTPLEHPCDCGQSSMMPCSGGAFRGLKGIKPGPAEL